MNWEALGAIGEIIGALAVFVTLVYLATQIRQNTSAVRAAAQDSSVGAVTDIRSHVFSDPEITKIYLKGLEDPDSLDPVEKARFTLVMHNILWSLWNVYSQSSFAELSSDIWESQIHVVKRVFGSNGGQQFLDNHGHEFPDSFMEVVRGFVSDRKVHA